MAGVSITGSMGAGENASGTRFLDFFADFPDFFRDSCFRAEDFFFFEEISDALGIATTIEECFFDGSVFFARDASLGFACEARIMINSRRNIRRMVLPPEHDSALPIVTAIGKTQRELEKILRGAGGSAVLPRPRRGIWGRN